MEGGARAVEVESGFAQRAVAVLESDELEGRAGCRGLVGPLGLVIVIGEVEHRVKAVLDSGGTAEHGEVGPGRLPRIVGLASGRAQCDDGRAIEVRDFAEALYACRDSQSLVDELLVRRDAAGEELEVVNEDDGDLAALACYQPDEVGELYGCLLYTSPSPRDS